MVEDIVKNGSDQGRRWLWSHLVRRVGSGGNTSFGIVCRLTLFLLRIDFRDYIILSELKEGLVSDAGVWVNGSWKWRRVLFDREISIVSDPECFINRFPLKENVDDTWK